MKCLGFSIYYPCRLKKSNPPDGLSLSRQLVLDGFLIDSGSESNLKAMPSGATAIQKTTVRIIIICTVPIMCAILIHRFHTLFNIYDFLVYAN